MILLQPITCTDNSASLAPIATTTAAIIRNTRGGGGLFGLFQQRKKNAKETYRESLESQIQKLERQVRTAKEESSQMRKNLNLALSDDRGSSASLRQELKILQKQAEHLESFQSELEKLLQDEVKRNVGLQKELTNADMDAQTLRKQHKLELEALEKSLLETSKAQMEKLTQLMEERVKEAAERARAETMLEMEAKLKEVLSQAEKTLEKAVQEERKKGKEAVEHERFKMKKLVKALADREKKAVAAVQEKVKKRTVKNKVLEAEPQTISDVAPTSEEKLKKKKHKNKKKSKETVPQSEPEPETIVPTPKKETSNNPFSFKSSIKKKKAVLHSPNVRSPI
eukprot:CAMPEP_0194218992 /NCGR_PEP_ID=MMETSP0156-20130528/24986_1 /TAXON_ID=33649 /ORGANISM="Thalassionema nitzschioides, Strain L26-B" /LENGTH=339 /DNA_ID=CAMNT_0038948523 /DNA_START=109 /DNA_END=1128 /DNA_ORIENTATION=-